MSNLIPQSRYLLRATSITLLFSIPSYAQHFPVEMTFKSGQNVTYKYISNGTADTEMNGQPVHMSFDMNADIFYTTKEHSEGNLIHEFSFNTLRLENKGGFMTPGVVDTKHMLNKPLQAKTDLTGKHFKVLNIDRMPLSGPFMAFPDITPLLYLIYELPSGKVKEGLQWKALQEFTFDPEGATKSEAYGLIDFKILGLEKRMGYNCVKIEGKGVMKGTIDGEIQNASMRTEMKSEKLSITGYFAYEEGIFVELEQVFSGTSDTDFPEINVQSSMTWSQTNKAVLVKGK